MSNLFDSDSFEDDDWLGTGPSSELDLSEEQRYQYCSVAVPNPKYSDLLKQAIKRNRNTGRYLKPNYYEKLNKGQKLTQRVYRVQRRKDIVRDDYSLSVDYGKGVSDRNIIKSFRFGVKYLKRLKIWLDQLSKPVMMTNWIRILQGKHLPKLKTFVLNPSSSDILKAREGRFPIYRSRSPNIESLKVIFNQMHGRDHIPIEDFTLKLIRGIYRLKNLCFDVYACAFMTDEHLGVIAKALRSGLHHLESLEMRFGAFGYNVTPKGVARLWKSLDKIPNLKKLELTGNYSRGADVVIDYEAFVILCDVIQRKSTTLTT